MSSLYQNKKKPIKISVVQISSFIVDILIIELFTVISFVDIKCFSYNTVNDKFVRYFNIFCVFMQFRLLKNVKIDTKSIKKIICLNINFLNHKSKKVCMYIFNKTLNYDIMLKLFWIQKNNVWINAKNNLLFVKKSETKIHQKNKKINGECHSISTVAYIIWMKKAKKNKNEKTIQSFIANMIDIEKTLTPKKKINLKKNLFKLYQDFTRLFEFKKTNKLLLFKKPEINHFIQLKKINDKIL